MVFALECVFNLVGFKHFPQPILVSRESDITTHRSLSTSGCNYAIQKRLREVCMFTLIHQDKNRSHEYRDVCNTAHSYSAARIIGCWETGRQCVRWKFFHLSVFPTGLGVHVIEAHGGKC